jgi:hypothetical protein
MRNCELGNSRYNCVHVSDEKYTILPHNNSTTLQMTSYIPPLIIPNCDKKVFEETVIANPDSLYRMDLIEGRLEIMLPVHNDTGE